MSSGGTHAAGIDEELDSAVLVAESVEHYADEVVGRHRVAVGQPGTDLFGLGIRRRRFIVNLASLVVKDQRLSQLSLLS